MFDNSLQLTGARLSVFLMLPSYVCIILCYIGLFKKVICFCLGTLPVYVNCDILYLPSGEAFSDYSQVTKKFAPQIVRFLFHY